MFLRTIIPFVYILRFANSNYDNYEEETSCFCYQEEENGLEYKTCPNQPDPGKNYSQILMCKELLNYILLLNSGGGQRRVGSVRSVSIRRTRTASRSGSAADAPDAPRRSARATARGPNLLSKPGATENSTFNTPAIRK